MVGDCTAEEDIRGRREERGSMGEKWEGEGERGATTFQMASMERGYVSAARM